LAKITENNDHNNIDPRSNSGIRKSVAVLERCSEDEDWSLATLVCQAIWNYSIETKFGQSVQKPFDKSAILCNPVSFIN
jgi:hypothetical protein